MRPYPKGEKEELKYLLIEQNSLVYTELLQGLENAKCWLYSLIQTDPKILLLIKKVSIYSGYF